MFIDKFKIYSLLTFWRSTKAVKILMKKYTRHITYISLKMKIYNPTFSDLPVKNKTEYSTFVYYLGKLFSYLYLHS